MKFQVGDTVLHLQDSELFSDGIVVSINSTKIKTYPIEVKYSWTTSHYKEDGSQMTPGKPVIRVLTKLEKALL